MTSYISVTDQFCGDGGSSLGAHLAGCEVKLAMNHWKMAIETHNTNFPQTDHVLADMSQVDPRRYPTTDILITSPECTSHTLAKGNARKNIDQLDLWGNHRVDPAEERSRATMWDVVRFAEFHRYNIVVVENVVDAHYWALFDVWLDAMHKLGYEHQALYINSMFAHPTPQSRDRLYVVFWRKGNRKPKLNFRPTAYCPACGKDIEAVQVWKNSAKKWGKYKSQYIYCCPEGHGEVKPYYHAAANVIDWSNLGGRIGDRKKPLKPKTMERIQKGLDKFGRQGLMIQVDYSQRGGNRFRPLTDPIPTQTARQNLAMAMPILVRNYTPGISAPITDPTGAITTQDHHSLVTPPFVMSYYTRDDAQSSIDDPLPTVTTEPRHSLVTPLPFMLSYMNNASPPRGVDEPLYTVATHHTSPVIFPPIPDAFLTHFYGTGDNGPVTDPMPTVMTVAHHGVVNNPVAQIEDCYFRMLTPQEIQRAMAFPDSYIVLGSNRDKIKQLGNAVTAPVMTWIIQRCVESLQ